MNFGSVSRGVVILGFSALLMACGKKESGVAAAPSPTPADAGTAPAVAAANAQPPANPSPDAAAKPPAPPAAVKPDQAAKPDPAARPARKASRSAASRGVLQRPADLEAQITALRKKLGLPAATGWKALRASLESRAKTDADAALLLGLALAYEPEFSAERAVAKEWLEQAAAAGNARAMAELGRLWLADDRSAQAPAQAERWLKAAWAAGETEGAFLLAIGRRLGLLETDGNDPIRLLVAAADQGNNRAAVLLNLLNKDEPLPDLDASRVLAWLERAADSGNVIAMMELADLTSRAGDPQTASKWYEKAAIAGSPDAPLRLVTLAMKQGRDSREQGRESLARAIDLLRAQIADPVSAPAESFLNLAALMLPMARTPETEAHVKLLLLEAKNRGNDRARLILLELERGATLRDALVPTMKLTTAQVFVRATELAPPTPRPDSPAAAEEFVAPRALHVIDPVFPVELRASGVAGKVVLVVSIGADGSVENVEAKSSPHAALSAAAIEAVQQWKFSPAQRNGKATAMKMALPITFKNPGGS